MNALAELAAMGVAFVSLRDNLDLSTQQLKQSPAASGKINSEVRARDRSGLLARPEIAVVAITASADQNTSGSWGLTL